MSNPENMNGVDSDGFTALTRAAALGSVDDVKSLITAGADVNTSDGKGTPVFYAASNRHLECLKLLVEAGAEVDKAVQDNIPIAVAAREGHLECLRVLIEAGADLDACGSEISTALIEAVNNEHDDCMVELIQAGADVNKSDAIQVTALLAAFGDFTCMETLIEAGAKVNTRIDGRTRNPLLEAVEENDIETVKFLMDYGAKLPRAKLCDYYNDGIFETETEATPLWTTLMLREFEMFDALIKGGAIKEGILTATYHAYYRGIKLAIQEGADVNWTDVHGNSVLSIDCSARRGYTVLMTAADADFSRVDATPKEMISCVKLILNAGARINVTNKRGKNALKICPESNSMKYVKDVAQLLFAAGEKISNPKPKVKILRKLKAQEEVSLEALCRKTIRNHLLQLDPHLNLFQRVPHLGLPAPLTRLMLFNRNLDVKENKNGGIDYDRHGGSDVEDSDSDDDDDDDDDDEEEEQDEEQDEEQEEEEQEEQGEDDNSCDDDDDDDDEVNGDNDNNDADDNTKADDNDQEEKDDELNAVNDEEAMDYGNSSDDDEGTDDEYKGQ